MSYGCAFLPLVGLTLTYNAALFSFWALIEVLGFAGGTSVGDESHPPPTAGLARNGYRRESIRRPLRHPTPCCRILRLCAKDAADSRGTGVTVCPPAAAPP
ncbi:hypothetical protein B0H11DRAFT_2226326 [Mycena galericulata]|nr:hypothetical protein B0H11DRAFT_2226326 [Mycena galericulata]